MNKPSIELVREFHETSAVFSPCRKYRYELWRRWADGPACVLIGLNPSTADETNDDPTIRRCIDYSKRWGFGAYCMLNLFGWRDTDPAKMKAQAEPIGEGNNDAIRRVCASAGIVVAAWGNHGRHMGRDAEVLAMVPGVQCLKRNKDGSPAHPLYLRRDLSPIPYTPPDLSRVIAQNAKLSDGLGETL